MIDKEKFPELYKATESTVESRQNWLADAIKCRDLCTLLPDEIKALHIISADYNSPNQLSLLVRNTNGTIRILKMLGIQGLKPEVSTFSKSTFCSTGRGKLPDGSDLAIRITGIEEPAGCHVVTKRKTVTEYELVCERADKEL